MTNLRSEEATSSFTPEGIEKLRKDKVKVLAFNQINEHGKIAKVDYKITKIAKGRIWIKQVEMVDPEHLKVVDSNE